LSGLHQPVIGNLDLSQFQHIDMLSPWRLTGDNDAQLRIAPGQQFCSVFSSMSPSSWLLDQ
jgi:hypothetical protein